MQIHKPKPQSGYHSSVDKDFIRDCFDLPLLERLFSIRGSHLNYFGLPGADLKDVKSWRHLLKAVAAVERNARNLRTMDDTVSRDMPKLHFTPHYGEIDTVILDNRGKRWKRGGEGFQPWVGNIDPETRQTFWPFDIVYLDYFGPFLPEDDEDARRRSDAIKRLFETERLDSWARWVLLITVEARITSEELRARLAGYLRAVQEGASAPAASILQYLNDVGSSDEEDGVVASRLIHGVSASLIALSASQASLRPYHRGTVLYRGSSDQPMVHLAFEFVPQEAPLPLPTLLLQLLRRPLLTTIRDDVPALSLLQGQVPGLTPADIRTAVDYLDSADVERLVAELP